jgi:hypothetical protein
MHKGRERAGWPVRHTAAALAASVPVAFLAYAAAAWVRYGRVHPERHPPDELLDRFLPHPEVDEYHELRVRAPADLTYAIARHIDLMRSPIVRTIFWLRAVPTMLHGEPFRPAGTRGLVEETLSLGWGVLAEKRHRELVVGAYTQPWHRYVTFHPLPPEEFAAFAEPGFVKIAWTIGATPLGPTESLVVTRTRAVATDPTSRRRFRLYWASMSAGIILIRHLHLPLVRREAEDRFGLPPRRGIGPSV